MFNDTVVPLSGLAVVCSLAAFLVRTTLKNILEDRGAGFELADRNRVQIERNESRISALETEVAEQRHLKHEVTNDLQRCRLLLEAVRRLAPDCTCGALRPVERLLTEDTS